MGLLRQSSAGCARERVPVLEKEGEEDGATAFFNFQILKTVFLNAEFHNEPARYLGYTRDRRKHDRSALTVPAPILACFLFAYVPGIVRPPEPAEAPWRYKSPLP